MERENYCFRKCREINGIHQNGPSELSRRAVLMYVLCFLISAVGPARASKGILAAAAGSGFSHLRLSPVKNGNAL